MYSLANKTQMYEGHGSSEPQEHSTADNMPCSVFAASFSGSSPFAQDLFVQCHASQNLSPNHSPSTTTHGRVCILGHTTAISALGGSDWGIEGSKA